MRLKLGFNAEEVINQNRVKKSDVEEISRWLEAEDLPEYGDEQIILFLLSCDNRVDCAKKTIKAYLEITNSSQEIFSNKTLQRADLQKFFKVVEMCVLPERTDDGYVILWYHLIDPNPKNYDILSFFILFNMTIESALYDSPAKGLIFVCDATGASWKHMTRLHFGLIRTFATYLQEALPVRLRKVCLINAIPILDMIMKAVRPFLKKEVLDKIEVYKAADIEMFYQNCLPKRILPADYGGDNPSVQTLHRNLIEKFDDLTEYFKAEEQQRKLK